MLKKTYYKIVKLFNYFPNINYISISADKSSSFDVPEYHFTSYYSVWLGINTKKNDALWGYVGTDFKSKIPTYDCMKICKDELNFSELISKEILSLSLDILYHIETELGYGVTIKKLIKDSGYYNEKLDYLIERVETKHVKDWASSYFYQDDDYLDEI